MDIIKNMDFHVEKIVDADKNDKTVKWEIFMCIFMCIFNPRLKSK